MNRRGFRDADLARLERTPLSPRVATALEVLCK
jgi:hypothetical protein